MRRRSLVQPPPQDAQRSSSQPRTRVGPTSGTKSQQASSSSRARKLDVNDRPAWNDTHNDLVQYKLTPQQLERRKEQRLSRNKGFTASYDASAEWHQRRLSPSEQDEQDDTTDRGTQLSTPTAAGQPSQRVYSAVVQHMLQGHHAPTTQQPGTSQALQLPSAGDDASSHDAAAQPMPQAGSTWASAASALLGGAEPEVSSSISVTARLSALESLQEAGSRSRLLEVAELRTALNELQTEQGHLRATLAQHATAMQQLTSQLRRVLQQPQQPGGTVLAHHAQLTSQPPECDVQQVSAADAWRTLRAAHEHPPQATHAAPPPPATAPRAAAAAGAAHDPEAGSRRALFTDSPSHPHQGATPPASRSSIPPAALEDTMSMPSYASFRRTAAVATFTPASAASASAMPPVLPPPPAQPSTTTWHTQDSSAATTSKPLAQPSLPAARSYPSAYATRSLGPGSPLATALVLGGAGVEGLPGTSQRYAPVGHVQRHDAAPAHSHLAAALSPEPLSRGRGLRPPAPQAIVFGRDDGAPGLAMLVPPAAPKLFAIPRDTSETLSLAAYTAAAMRDTRRS